MIALIPIIAFLSTLSFTRAVPLVSRDVPHTKTLADIVPGDKSLWWDPDSNPDLVALRDSRTVLGGGGCVLATYWNNMAERVQQGESLGWSQWTSDATWYKEAGMAPFCLNPSDYAQTDSAYPEPDNVFGTFGGSEDSDSAIAIYGWVIPKADVPTGAEMNTLRFYYPPGAKQYPEYVS